MATASKHVGVGCVVALLLSAGLAFFRALTESSRYVPTPRSSYDFIVVGGGTAGSLVAAELASTDPSWSVLLLEAGNGLRDSPVSEQSVPGGAPDNVAFENIDWRYRVESQSTPLKGDQPAGYEDRSFPIPRGRGLGGSNELNYMLHVRGTPGDYQVWQAATGDARWGPESMRSAEEEYERKITFAPKKDPHVLAKHWVASAAESIYGNNTGGSYNDPAILRDTIGGFHYEHAVRRFRQSTARQFLLPRMGLPNLDVVVGATAEQILLDASSGAAARASGVALTLAPCIVPSLSVPILGTLIPEMPCIGSGGRDAAHVGVTLSVNASKEVILSAGAYESPHILLRSGIGPRDELTKAGVHTEIDLPGVGKHLQDHPIIGLKYRFGSGTAWLPRSATKVWLGFPSTPWSWLTRGEGILSSSGCDLGYFGASSQAWSGRPDLQIHGMITAGDMPFFQGFLHYEKSYIDDVGVASDYSIFSEGLVIAPTLLHAKAEGRVMLRPLNRSDDTSSSGRKSWTSRHPIIEYEAFGDDDDVARLTEGIRRLQRIMSAPTMMQYEPTLLYAKSLADEFGADTEDYWAEYIKRFGFVVYHPTGTCKMGAANDSSAVVDPTLRVQGVEGLRVADASIMPDIVSGNTQVPTAAVAVQMVRILREEYIPSAIDVGKQRDFDWNAVEPNARTLPPAIQS